MRARGSELLEGLNRVFTGHGIEAQAFGPSAMFDVIFRDDTFGRDNPLVLMPWTQWLTWFFQVVPVFFAVAGYASAVSWARFEADGTVTAAIVSVSDVTEAATLREELRERAAELDIEGRSSMTKDELIDALRHH